MPSEKQSSVVVSYLLKDSRTLVSAPEELAKEAIWTDGEIALNRVCGK
jgi:hypothetical protein